MAKIIIFISIFFIVKRIIVRRLSKEILEKINEDKKSRCFKHPPKN